MGVSKEKRSFDLGEREGYDNSFCTHTARAPFLTDPLCAAKGSTRPRNARSTTKSTASAATKATTSKTKAKGAVYIAS